MEDLEFYEYDKFFFFIMSMLMSFLGFMMRLANFFFFFLNLDFLKDERVKFNVIND